LVIRKNEIWNNRIRIIIPKANHNDEAKRDNEESENNKCKGKRQKCSAVFFYIQHASPKKSAATVNAAAD
jgi:hypothetical protein